MQVRTTKCLLIGALLGVAATSAFAGNDEMSNGCAALPSHAELKAALSAATIAEASGLNLQMWGTIVDRDGIVSFGALGVGGLKMKIHRAAIARLFESNDQVLDAESIFELAEGVA